VLGFFSSRRNWDSPTPSPAGECVSAPLVRGGGTHSLAGEGVGGSQFRRGDRQCGTTVCMYFVPTLLSTLRLFNSSKIFSLDIIKILYIQPARRKIRLILQKAMQCRHLKKYDNKGTLRQVFICPLPSYDPIPHLTHCLRVYSILIQAGKGADWTREKVRWAKVNKAGSKIPTWQSRHLQYMNSDKHLSQSSFTRQFLRWRHSALVSTYLISPWAYPLSTCFS
jgi:hypothetical protein